MRRTDCAAIESGGADASRAQQEAAQGRTKSLSASWVHPLHTQGLGAALITTNLPKEGVSPLLL